MAGRFRSHVSLLEVSFSADEGEACATSCALIKAQANRWRVIAAFGVGCHNSFTPPYRDLISLRYLRANKGHLWTPEAARKLFEVLQLSASKQGENDEL